jgi:hypothetical protein
MGIASPPAAARNVTVENFLPQQENFLPQQGWGRAKEFKFPEGKIHYHFGNAALALHAAMAAL